METSMSVIRFTTAVRRLVPIVSAMMSLIVESVLVNPSGRLLWSNTTSDDAKLRSVMRIAEFIAFSTATDEWVVSWTNNFACSAVL